MIFIGFIKMELCFVKNLPLTCYHVRYVLLIGNLNELPTSINSSFHMKILLFIFEERCPKLQKIYLFYYFVSVCNVLYKIF